MLTISASPYTRLFWNEFLLQPDSFKYNIVLDQTITGPLDRARLEKALKRLTEVYFLSQCYLEEHNGRLFWKKAAPSEAPLLVNLHSEAEMDAFIRQPFDLSRGPLGRYGIWSKSPTHHELLFTQHHVLVDAMSTEELYTALSTFYNNPEIEADVPGTAEVAARFAEFERELTEIEQKYNPGQFWQECLKNCNETNALPFIQSDSSAEEGVGAVRFSIPVAEWNRLKSSVRYAQHFLVFKTLWAIMIARYSQSEQVHLTYPVAIEGGAGLVFGAQINTTVFPLHITASDTFNTLYRKTLDYSRSLRAAPGIRYTQWPVFNVLRSSVVRELNVSFSQAHFKDLFLQFDGCKAQYNHRFNYDIASTALLMEYQAQPDVFNFRIRYQTTLFDAAQIQEIAEQFQQLFCETLSAVDTPICQLPYLTPEQLHRHLTQWNAIPPNTMFKPASTLHSSVREQARLYPDRPALADRHETLTYRELEARSNQMARWIRQHYQSCTGKDIVPDTLIPLLLNRGVEMIVALLAIMKSGAAYVPLDPATPLQRLAYILKDCAASLIVTENALAKNVQAVAPEIHILSTAGPQSYHLFNAAPLEHQESDRQLAYVIYTSGTTGNPKGTLLEHRGILNTIAGTQDFLLPKRAKPYHCLQFASIAFDGHIAESFIALCGGHLLVVASEKERKDLDALLALLEDYQIEHATIPPTLLKLKPELPPCLQMLQVAGEPTPLNVMEHYKRKGIQLFNTYGPTETSVAASSNPYCHNGARNIGRPLPNTHLYVLDSHLQPVPVGVIGELYISGPCLARGYLNLPEQTAASFISNPFSTHPDHSRFYRTRDLARWLPAGEIEYIGRNDFQIKRNGHRIELGEIEQVLSTFEGVRQCAATITDKEPLRIVVYYTATHTLPEAEISRLFHEKLPGYMIPDAIVQLERLPMTMNGKLDAAALPVPGRSRATHAFRAAGSPLEQCILNVWQNVLGMQRISVDDDFFRLGGDSIAVIRVVSELRRLALSCSTQDIYQHRTIAELAQYLSVQHQAHQETGEQGTLSGTFPLHPIQHWFFEQHFPHSAHWNQAFLIKVPPLDQERLQDAIARLLIHHDSLRLHFSPPKAQNPAKQTYLETIPQPALLYCNRSAFSEEALNAQMTAWQDGFDYQHGPLWQFAYIDGYEDGSARIYCAFHHLLVDAVSWRIIAHDLRRLYEGETLTTKSASYRQWQKAIQDYSRQINDEMHYWRAQCAGQIDYRRYLSPTDQLNIYTLKLDLEETAHLFNQSASHPAHQPDHLLLAALLKTLEQISGHSAHTLMLENHGRTLPGSLLDTGRTIGWFTTLYPLLFTTGRNPETTLENIHALLDSVPAQGLGYGALRYLECTKEAALTLPYPGIVFNYLGRFETGIQNWRITDEPAGMTLHPHNIGHILLALNIWIIDGELSCRFDGALSTFTLEQLAQIFKKALYTALKTSGQSTAVMAPAHAFSEALLARLQQDNPLEGICPANSLQQGFIYHHLNRPDDESYRLQAAFDYHTALDPALYARAWQIAIARYPILRTCFNWEETLLQIICRHAEPDWEYMDYSEVPNQEEAIQALCRSQQKTPFDLRKPQLMRLRLIKLGEQHYCLIKTTHHSITDGWSEQILFSFIHETYAALLENKTPTPLPERTYPEAQRYYQLHQEACNNYWESQCLEQYEACDIRLLLGEPAADTNLSLPPLYHYKQALPDTLTLSLQNLARNHGLTLNTILQFAWHKLLHIFTGQDTTLVGTTLSGRTLPLEQIEQSVGLFINTLPLALEWNNKRTSLEQLELLQEKIAELNTHCFQSLARLQPGGKPLFHHLFVFENYPAAPPATLPFTLRSADEHTDYPLTVAALLDQEKLFLQLTATPHGPQPQTTLKRVFQLFETLLSQLPTHLHYPHYQLTALSTAERQLILETWNQTESAPLPYSTLHGDIEKQARLHPDRVALIDDYGELTYGELEKCSSQLAALLRHEYREKTGVNIEAGCLIGLCCHRNIDMVIAMIAILKTGAAYVPMDARAPQERLNHIVEDSQIQMVLTQRAMQKRFQQPGLNCLYMEVLVRQLQNFAPLPRQPISPHDLAYIIYTSGTTGKPKGTLLEHRGAVNTVHCLAQHFMPEKGSHARTLHFSSIVFDAHIIETYLPLNSGRTLVIASDEQRNDLQALLSLIDKHQVEFAFIPPALLRLKPELPASLTCIMVGGESISQEILDRYTAEGRQIFNCYGPTEDSICTTLNHYRYNGACNIGKPLANKKCYILNAHLQPQPIGATGELYIAGQGLARSYLNRPELTAEKFIRNPFSNAPDYQQLYRSGDIVRWLPTGEIEFIGRNDFQVKINGQRVETAEIEATINAVEGVRQSVVAIQQEQYAPRIIAYYTETRPVDKQHLRTQLSRTLPEYMIPDAFVPLDEIPLMLNGKTDLNALPRVSFDSTDEKAPLSSAEELEMGALWTEILGCKHLGSTDNFFQLGGNSINAIQLCNRLSQTAGYTVSVTALNAHPTVRALCAYLKEKKHDELPGHTIALERKKAPLSAAQLRLWFIEEFMQGSPLYHIPILLELPADTDIAAYAHSLEAVIERHHALRSTMQQDDDGQVYAVLGDAVLETALYPVEARAWTETLHTAINRPFDLRNEYPIRSTLFKRLEDDGKHTLFGLINIHHIAFDGWSFNILLQELSACYAARSQGATAELPPLPIQYADYASWQNNAFATGHKDQLTAFWMKKLEGCQPLNLPTDYPRPAEFRYDGATLGFSLDEALSNRLRTLARSLGVTLHAILLTGVNILFSRYSGQQDILLGCPVANRTSPELEPLIGFFTNPIVLRNRIQPEQSVITHIQAAFQNTIECLQYQDMPFEKLVENLQLDRDLSRHPLFQVVISVERQITPPEAAAQFKLCDLSADYQIAKFDLGLRFEEGAPEIKAHFNYATALFSATTIGRMVTHLIQLLTQMAEAPETPVNRLAMLSDKETARLLHPETEKRAREEYDHCLHEGFIHWAKAHPEDIALIDADGVCTYGVLYQTALTLANQIMQLDETSPLIAIMADKGRAQIAAVLSVLMAGHAYLPIDASWPQRRRETLIEQTGANLILSNVPWQIEGVCTFVLDKKGQAQNQPPPPVPLAPARLPKTEALAYVIFTSGATGTPKGVAIEHRSASNTLVDINARLGIQAGDTVFAISALSFDLSVYDIFGLLRCGGRLVLPSEEARYQPDKWVELMQKHHVTLWNSTPALFELLMQHVEQFQIPANQTLRQIMLSGDWIAASLPERSRQWAPQSRFFSAGGSTEASIWSALYPVTPGECFTTRIPYGKPLTNQTLYILDNHLNPVPEGLEGILYIGGEALARGYYNDPVQTAAQFFYHDKIGKRIYNTGDRARRLADGSIELLGRIDNQIKFNGYRIELGEIENALLAFNRIRQCLVLKTRTGPDRLIAYYISAEPIEEETLRQHLSQSLPDYMMPWQFIHLVRFPLNASGKIDPGALPSPVQTPDDRPLLSEPETEQEKALCTLWQHVLGVKNISITDDFFTLGGTSILAITLCQKMNILLSQPVPVVKLFKNRTIRALLNDLESEHQLVQTLNTPHRNADTLWMIHPAMAGCEPYIDLAERLEGAFNCVGIDNYNLYHSSGIHSLQELAALYLDQMMQHSPIAGQPVRILGWSLGGLIALEIAARLEAQGMDDIELYLLDSHYRVPASAHNIHQRKTLISELGIHGVAARRALAATPAEEAISQGILSAKLRHTRVTLYKATRLTEFHYAEGLKTSTVISKDNQIGETCQHLRIVPLACDHHTIIEETIPIIHDLLQSIHSAASADNDNEILKSLSV